MLQVRELLGYSSLLERRLGFYLEELQFDELMVGRDASKLCKDAARFLLAIMVDQPPWRVGHEYHAYKEDDGRRELQTDGDEP